MNNLPKIIIKDSYGVDSLDTLKSVTMTSDVDTVAAPISVTTYATIISWIPSDKSTLIEFNAPNITSFSGTMLSGYTQLRKVTMDKCIQLSFSSSGNSTNGMFYNNGSLNEVDFQNVTTLNTYSGRDPNGGWSSHCMFNSCANLNTVNMPRLTTISCTGDANVGGAFYNCISLKSVTLPKLKTITGSFGFFNTCTNLETLILGSEGDSVTALSSNAFKGCTQSGLTITVYTTDGASLANQPWGATNATIIYEEA